MRGTHTCYYSEDYCNSVLHRVATIHVQALQNKLLNTAARIILWKRNSHHWWPSNPLHWLPFSR